MNPTKRHYNYKTPVVFALVLFIALGQQLAWSRKNNSQEHTSTSAPTTVSEFGPHGGTVVRDRDGSSEFELYFGEDGQIEIYNLNPQAINNPKLSPKEMTVTLYRSPHDSQTIELKAMPPGGANTPLFHGKTAVSEGSFMGFELKFRAPDRKGLKVLKHMPPIRPAR